VPDLGSARASGHPRISWPLGDRLTGHRCRSSTGCGRPGTLPEGCRSGTTNGSASWPDPWSPVHRHHVGACELLIDASPSTVAAAMRQIRQSAPSLVGLSQIARSTSAVQDLAVASRSACAYAESGLQLTVWSGSPRAPAARRRRRPLAPERASAFREQCLWRPVAESVLDGGESAGGPVEHPSGIWNAPVGFNERLNDLLPVRVRHLVLLLL
jgi:hypothetical protein